MKIETILEHYPDEQFLIIDGYDDCILGIDIDSMRLIYSVDSIILKLSNDMSEEDAVEYFNFNIQGAYFGEQTPIYCYEDLQTM